MSKQAITNKTGVWIIGAGGEIATTMVVGALAIRKGLADTTGFVTCMPPMAELSLVTLDQLVFGGIDIRPVSLTESARNIAANSRTFSRDMLDAVTPELDALSEDILIEKDLNWNPLKPAPSISLPALDEIVTRLRRHIRNFADKHGLQRIIVVNLASAEAHGSTTPAHEHLAGFEALIRENRRELVSPSMCYAYAALLEDCAHINFTPSPAATIGALQELAATRNLPFYGDDGKTGETLVKTVLAPMFVQRNLRVLSWEGINMLGNGDGKTLENPQNCEAKIRNKAEVLNNILGYRAHADVDIKYVPSLGDWKTAWDLIHFAGFLNVPMTMQFTWQGCDSILAAPLVLDMVRMGEYALRQGESGPMHHLASFFKNPVGVSEMALYPQFEMLLEYTYDHLRREQSKKKVTPAC